MPEKNDARNLNLVRLTTDNADDFIIIQQKTLETLRLHGDGRDYICLSDLSFKQVYFFHDDREGCECFLRDNGEEHRLVPYPEKELREETDENESNAEIFLLGRLLMGTITFIFLLYVAYEATLRYP